MYIVMGAAGQTGSIVAHTLLAQKQPIRVVVRKPEQAEAWQHRGAEAALADAADADALTLAFAGATAAYLLNPPAYHDPDLFARAHRVHAAQIEAARRAGLARIVALSSVGGQHATGTGNILTTYDWEQQLAGADTAQIVILRAANFIENWAWVLRPVLEHGILPSMFLPLERKLPMQSIVDVGKTAAGLMTAAELPLAPPSKPSGETSRKPANGRHLVELHGPEDYSPEDAAAAFGSVLGKLVRAVAVPESDWPGVFAKEGFAPMTVAAFCEMYRGFNSGHIAFEGTHHTLRGRVALKDALEVLVAKQHQHQATAN